MPPLLLGRNARDFIDDIQPPISRDVLIDTVARIADSYTTRDLFTAGRREAS